MDFSDDDFKPLPDSYEPSSATSDLDLEPIRKRTSPSHKLKRRRADSLDSLHPVTLKKPRLQANYNEAYRILFNEVVATADDRFGMAQNNTPQVDDTQIGASQWSTEEKALFFAALERFGKDNLPAIADAVSSKSPAEISQLLLLLRDSVDMLLVKNREPLDQMTMQDIPAALEIGPDCEGSLESASDALAWLQNRFEAKQEQERYGRYWLIESEIAEEIEQAVVASRQPRHVSPDPASNNEGSHADKAQDPQILIDIPEAKLLNAEAFLRLSKCFFMNPCADLPYPWPHWSEYVRDSVAAEPSMFRTAFNDFHRLVVTLTGRLVQVAVVQATSRLRAQAWRGDKGLRPLVRRSDVLTSLSLLRMERNGHESWRGVARRCGLRVVDGRRRARDFERGLAREVPWNEVELRLAQNRLPKYGSSDPIPAEPRPRASKSSHKVKTSQNGTPLRKTSSSVPLGSESENNDGSINDLMNTESDNHSTPYERDTSDHESEQSRNREPIEQLTDEETETLEVLDQTARVVEEHQLWQVLGAASIEKEDLHKAKIETEEKGSNQSRARPLSKRKEDLDWRDWTSFRAEWEEFWRPPPQSYFAANRTPGNIEDVSNSGNATDSNHISREREGSTHRRRPSTAELPIRGPLAYAARKVKNFVSEEFVIDSDLSNDEVKVPAQSIEHFGGYANANDAGMSDIDNVS